MEAKLIILQIGFNFNQYSMQQASLIDLFKKFQVSSSESYYSALPVRNDIQTRTSAQILARIYKIINSVDSYKKGYQKIGSGKYQKMEVEYSDNAGSKCSCKKSKCLKLYCECFAKGIYCQGCSCFCCDNKQEFSESRALALDLRVSRSSNGQIVKGCFCKKTNCLKKYCECFSNGGKCHSECRCEDCENSL